MKTPFTSLRVFCAAVMAFTLAHTAHAQWQTQTVTLKPGWNAVFLHVDASHILLDDLVVGSSNPIAEIWLWQPPLSTVQFVTSPSSPTTANSQWAVWDRSASFTDTLTRLTGNAAYLVHNTNSVDFVWSVTGKPVAPRYQWTTTGLNFVGFPTPTNVAPDFDTFLSPLPEFKAQFQPNLPDAGIYRYPGGELGSGNPTRVIYQMFRSTYVKHGEAFWINAGKGVYNRYFGPFEVVLQDSAGVMFWDNRGTYSVRLKNTSSTNRTVTINLNLLASEAAPAGQTPIVGTPPMLVRGAFNTTNLTYSYINLTGQQTYTLAGAGSEGSEIEIILGLNRSAMTGAAGSLYAGVLRFTDTSGLEQVDVPVSATVGNTSGLWVGSAAVTTVNHYLKTYANTNNPGSVPATDAAGYAIESLPGSTWTAQPNQSTPRIWRSVASSTDGAKLVAVVNAGQIYTSTDFGLTWIARANSLPWIAVASSADGSRLAAVANADVIYTSIDSGITWTGRLNSGVRNWTAIASSSDGSRLAATTSGGNIYTSTDSGINWTAQTAAGSRSWTAIASSADGMKLIAAAANTNLFTSIDAGTNWTERVEAGTNAWTALASSADGLRLVAAATGTNIYTSINSGTNWTRQLNSSAVAWSTLASSIDGSKLVGAANGGQIYASTDSGATWMARDSNRSWSSVATSADGAKLVAVVNGGQIYTAAGSFVTIEVDPNSGRVIARGANGAPYVATATNTVPGAVARPYALRLIVHNNGTANTVNLMQRVYFGNRFGTNLVVATRESLLDTATLDTARRISATHLPFSHENACWPKISGAFSLGSSLTFNVNLDYNNQVSNPFLHTYHPDHDNLKSDFQTVEVQGAESYTVTRQITLLFTSPAADFASLTAASDTLTGVYSEVVTFFGRAGNSRQFNLGGSFVLNRISPVATLTTE